LGGGAGAGAHPAARVIPRAVEPLGHGLVQGVERLTELAGGVELLAEGVDIQLRLGRLPAGRERQDEAERQQSGGYPLFHRIFLFLSIVLCAFSGSPSRRRSTPA